MSCKDIKLDRNCYAVAPSKLTGGVTADVNIASYICDTDHRSFVVKDYGKRSRMTARHISSLLGSLAISKKMIHPNIAELCGYIVDSNFARDKGWDPDHMYGIFEYVPGSNLWDFMRNNGNKYNVIELNLITGYIAWKILDGLDYIHTTSRIVHFDLKPANIVVSDDLEKVKIIDFDLMLPIGSIEKQFATPAYMPPDFPVNNTVSDAKSQTDIWAIGCTFYELFTNRPFLHDVDRFLEWDINSGTFNLISEYNSRFYLQGEYMNNEKELSRFTSGYITDKIVDLLLDRYMTNSILKEVCKGALQIKPKDRLNAAELMWMCQQALANYFDNFSKISPIMTGDVKDNIPDYVAQDIAILSHNIKAANRYINSPKPDETYPEIFRKLIPTFQVPVSENPFLGGKIAISIYPLALTKNIERIVFSQIDDNWERNGITTIWSLQGKKIKESNYVNGIKNGAEINWYLGPGTIHTIEHYVNGKLNGVGESWSREGRLLTRITYVDDVQEGLKQYYWDNIDHNLKYSAVMVNGVPTEEKRYTDGGVEILPGTFWV